MNALFKISILVLVTAIAHADDPQQEEAFPSFDSGVVVRGANLTWRNYVQWWNKTQGTPLSGDKELAANLWADAIAKLKPEYVYTHGVNLVIVRSLHGEEEEGFYVALGIASGPGPNDHQFTRMLIAHHAGGTVFTFHRRGHFERARIVKSKETRPTNKNTDASAGGQDSESTETP